MVILKILKVESHQPQESTSKVCVLLHSFYPLNSACQSVEKLTRKKQVSGHLALIYTVEIKNEMPGKEKRSKAFQWCFTFAYKFFELRTIQRTKCDGNSHQMGVGTYCQLMKLALICQQGLDKSCHLFSLFVKLGEEKNALEVAFQEHEMYWQKKSMPEV